MAGNRDPQRRPVLYDLKNQRLLADPAIGSTYYPINITGSYLTAADIGVTVQGYDATLLNAADIGVTVQGYDATLLNAAEIGVTLQGYDAGLAYLGGLGFNNEATFKQGVNLEIGVDVQAYDADTAKLDVAQTFTADQTFTSTQTYPRVPQNAQPSAYTLVASDAGKHSSILSGGVTVPSGVFAVGDAVSIYNNSGSSQTITQGISVTLRLAGSASTGNRTLSQYGLCTILCVASNTFVVSGAIIS